MQDLHPNPLQGRHTSNGGLSLREKLAVTIMLLMLATCGACAYAKRHQKLSSIQKTIIVHCKGACAKEVDLQLPQGAKVSDLLAQVELAGDADVTKLVQEVRLKNDQIFIIPKKGAMMLYITGAIKQPGVVCVPEGLRFNELKRYLDLPEEADVAVFRRRRRHLSEGETINIPTKSEQIARK